MNWNRKAFIITEQHVSESTKNKLDYLCKRLSPSRQTFTCLKSIIETIEKGVNMFKVNNKTPERRHWHHSCVFIVNFEHILHLLLLFLFLTNSRYMLCCGTSFCGCRGHNKPSYFLVFFDWTFLIQQNENQLL